MILFKVADKRLAEIGFIKVEENETMTMFRRVNKKLGYTQHLALIRGENGQHIALSYDRGLRNRRDHVGDNADGLTMYEMKLCVRKMRELGWKIDKPKRRKKKCVN